MERILIEKRVREEIARVCHTLYQKDMVSSTGGNISVKNGEEIFITPSGQSLGRMSARMIVKTDSKGEVIGRGLPSKEIRLHCAVYENRPEANAVIHAHAPYSIAISCLPGSRGENTLPPLTPGYVLRVGHLPLVEYFRPGSAKLAERVGELARKFKAILLQNHGLVAVGKDLNQALDLVEEVEENAKIYLLTQGKARILSPEEIQEILNYANKKAPT